MPPTPTLANAEGQIFPEMTAIATDYWDRDGRFVMDRLAPVTRGNTPLRRVTKWAAADMLPYLGRIARARGDEGVEIGVIKPTYEDFFINGGQITARIPNEEFRDAPKTDPDRPARVRTKIAANFLMLENELRGFPYFDPTNATYWAGGAANPNAAAQIIAPSGLWETENPTTDKFISKDIRTVFAAYDLMTGTRPNWCLWDTTSDIFVLDKLAQERDTRVVASYLETPDLLPSGNGKTLNGATVIVPGARVEGTPQDATYSPERAWGNFKYFICGYSPSLDGSLWDETGQAYITNGEYVEDGRDFLETIIYQDPHYAKNKLWNMVWDFNRQIKVLKSELVMAIGPIRA